MLVIRNRFHYVAIAYILFHFIMLRLKRSMGWLGLTYLCASFYEKVSWQGNHLWVSF
jgi:hypothetical protein